MEVDRRRGGPHRGGRLGSGRALDSDQGKTRHGLEPAAAEVDLLEGLENSVDRAQRVEPFGRLLALPAGLREGGLGSLAGFVDGTVHDDNYGPNLSTFKLSA